MTPLKLLALDEADLQIISSHLQDAVVRVADMAYVPEQKRFAAILNRFDWEEALDDKEGGQNRRRRTAIRFDRVFAAQTKGVPAGHSDVVLSLLAIRFEPTDAPSGTIDLIFSGDVSIRLQAECIEVELTDLGPAWETKNRPQHPDSKPGAEV